MIDKFKNFFSATKNVAKRSTVAILCMVLVSVFAITSCIKQKKCDCGISGKFVYFEEPEEIIYCGNERKVNAAIVPNDLIEERRFLNYYCIVGSIPKEFRTKDTVNVTVCLKEEKRGVCLAHGVGVVYNLKCIEKED